MFYPVVILTGYGLAALVLLRASRENSLGAIGLFIIGMSLICASAVLNVFFFIMK